MARRVTIVFIAALVAAAVTAVGAAASGAEGPRIHLTEHKFDFGKVREGELTEHVFEIRNVGDDILILKQVHPS